MIVVEPDAALAAAALEHRPPEVFPDGLKLIIGEPAVQAYQTIGHWLQNRSSDIRFIEHPASSRQRPDYYRTLAGIFRAQDVATQGGFKILLVSPIYGGSQPVTDYVRRALNSLGHRCEVLDNTVFHPGLSHLNKLTPNQAHQAQLQGLLTSLLAESITARAVEMQADLVLGLAQSPFTAEVLSELHKVGMLTAFWFIEDGELFKYWKSFALFSTIISRSRKANSLRICARPAAVNPLICLWQPIPRSTGHWSYRHRSSRSSAAMSLTWVQAITTAARF